MTGLQEIFKEYAPQYLRLYENRMPKNHVKAIEAIIGCRTAQSGIVVYDCPGCNQVHVHFCSCGNRHCNICQGHKTRQWLEKQIDRQLPGHHFMITFTIPEQLRSFCRSHQRIVYEAMFAASARTLKAFAADPKFMGGDLPGFFGVLHTWGRQLQYHPHIHYVVTGGAVSTSDGKWHPARLDFFAPVKAMSRVFRAKLRDLLAKQGLIGRINPAVWKLGFNVNSQYLAGSHDTIRYLAPYVFKVAITNHRIIKAEDGHVFIRYKKSGGNRWRSMALPAMEFMRRFLQHVLPTGFMKVRYFGFMGAKPRIGREKIRTLIELTFGFVTEDAPTPEMPATALPACSECGGRLVLRYVARSLFGPVKGTG